MSNDINRKYVWKYFKANPYVAHRGLFDPATDRQENSLPAFRAAAEQGYGIELDVQQTADHKLVVFHDEDLNRMCGVNKKVRECTYNELLGYSLNGTDEKIPLFKEVLQAVNGRVPLIVELKSDGDWIGTTKLTIRHLDMYPGPYVIESFSPSVVLLYRILRPQVVRGQLASNFDDSCKAAPSLFLRLCANLFFNPITAPDFVAYDCLFRDTPALNRVRRKGKIRLVTWTIRSQEELELNRSYFETYIFDSFIPEDRA